MTITVVAKPVPLSKGFLDAIPSLSTDEKSFLAGLAADSPAMLWGMIQASPEPFGQRLGSDQTSELAAALWDMIPGDQRRVLGGPSFPPPPPGVAIDQHVTAGVPEPSYDIEKRDQLFRELQGLKGQDSLSAKRDAECVRQELITLLNGDKTRG